jgi:methylenetetrahydrofolate--tRNA-(uracil-5-)-methyltransferase
VPAGADWCDQVPAGARQRAEDTHLPAPDSTRPHLPAPDSTRPHPSAPEGDYLNCPFTKDEYDAFYDALVAAESATVHDFDSVKFFEGCLPIEVMAHRGRDTLRFGPMKPVGLTDPRTGRFPYAVVQLRQDTLAGDHYSLVGFQTQIKWGDQARVLRMIPGLGQAEFVRFGMVHRNTYICGPRVLRPTWQTRFRDDLFFAGQVSGVEGYVESAASGLLAGRNAAALARGQAPRTLPRTTAIGALAHYVSHADPAHYQPSNITHGIMESLPNPPRDKARKKALIADRALADLQEWLGRGALAFAMNGSRSENS